VICFAVSSVAENEEHYGRQRPHAERYPKPKLARSSTLPSHLCGKGYRRKTNDENENRPHVHLTISDCHRNHTTDRRSNAGPQQKVRPPQLAASSISQPFARCASIHAASQYPPRHGNGSRNWLVSRTSRWLRKSVLGLGCVKTQRWRRIDFPPSVVSGRRNLASLFCSNRFRKNILVVF
jgi:hypothetical protein